MLVFGIKEIENICNVCTILTLVLFPPFMRSISYCSYKLVLNVLLSNPHLTVRKLNLHSHPQQTYQGFNVLVLYKLTFIPRVMALVTGPPDLRCLETGSKVL